MGWAGRLLHRLSDKQVDSMQHALACCLVFISWLAIFEQESASSATSGVPGYLGL
jgi:hypothetical protein